MILSFSFIKPSVTFSILHLNYIYYKYLSFVIIVINYIHCGIILITPDEFGASAANTSGVTFYIVQDVRYHLCT